MRRRWHNCTRSEWLLRRFLILLLRSYCSGCDVTMFKLRLYLCAGGASVLWRAVAASARLCHHRYHVRFENLLSWRLFVEFDVCCYFAVSREQWTCFARGPLRSAFPWCGSSCRQAHFPSRCQRCSPTGSAWAACACVHCVCFARFSRARSFTQFGPLAIHVARLCAACHILLAD